MSARNDPRATVERMVAAFRAADLDALVETVHPESRWTYYGANPKPTSATLVGRPAVRRFFERMLERLEMTAFDTDERGIPSSSSGANRGG